MKSNLTAQQRDIVANNNGLTRYLLSLQEGRPFTPRSGVYEDLEPETVKDMGIEKLSSLEKGNFYEQEVFHFDLTAISKGGPQGGVEPISKLMALVEEDFQDVSPIPVFSSKEWASAKLTVVHELTKLTGQYRLRPASYSSVLDDMRARDTLESNSGGPLFARRNKPDVIEASIADAKSGVWKEYPAIVLFRNYNNKTRKVYMYPLATNLVEGSFIDPLFKRIINEGSSSFSPGEGFERVKDVIHQHYSDDESSIAASDFTLNDKHFTLNHSLEVYDVIKECFQKQYGDELKDSMMRFNTIPLVVGINSILSGTHGGSSGSRGTSFIETMFDHIFGIYVHMITSGKISSIYSIGDDIAGMTRPYNIETPKILSELANSVGQIINEEKVTNNPDSVKSLQRLFIRGYNNPKTKSIRGVYPTLRALKTLVYPEKFHNPKLWNSDMFCARVFMILENCVDHPLFEDFVKFIARSNKHLIPFSKKKKAELTKITRETKLLPAFNPTYNQEKRDSSLANFESIRIASNL